MKNSNANVGFLFPNEKFPFYHGDCDDLFITSKYIKVDIGMTSLQTDEDSIIHGMLNEVLQKLTPAGIPQYLLTHHALNFYGTEKIVKERKPEILSIGDLKFVFVLWMFGCGTAAITLALEILRVFQFRKAMKMFLNKVYSNY